ncbi:NUDIX domain-containing protein [Halobacillus litoralis]|uniref:NUDIX hydrolase n=1 Tax=Halobacillus litoralis TaxID=45668 RepID=UPI001CFEB786|nr:NUDIX domain-containing protein [Halobacillus litoralis]WLR48556.1 NUDIX domain-containing protein [Halobacillus litoralis]
MKKRSILQNLSVIQKSILSPTANARCTPLADLLFKKRFGTENNDGYKKNKRLAVRGIIFREGKILMVKSNLGDYKLPGGGVDEGEKDEEALIREIQEETGFKNCQVKQYAGVVVESHLDAYVREAVFEMTSRYYFCKWSGEKGEQKLDSYEEDQEFTPVWVSVEEAISNNEKTLDFTKKNSWIQRENYVLKQLLNSMQTS